MTRKANIVRTPQKHKVTNWSEYNRGVSKNREFCSKITKILKIYFSQAKYSQISLTISTSGRIL